MGTYVGTIGCGATTFTIGVAAVGAGDGDDAAATGVSSGGGESVRVGVGELVMGLALEKREMRGGDRVDRTGAVRKGQAV
jgi:hypothetical protein